MYRLTWESHWLENDPDGIEKYEVQYKNDVLGIFEWRLFAFVIPTIGIYSPKLQWFFTDINNSVAFGEFRVRSFNLFGVPSNWVSPKIEEEPLGIVDGVKIYDPRDNLWKVSDNPALVMADLACRGVLKTGWRLDKALDNFFWDKIGELADFCDDKIN